MTKNQLIQVVAKKHNDVPLKSIKIAVNTVFASISNALVRDCRLEVRGFGIFIVRNRDAWEARNLRTGEAVPIPNRRVPFFKAGTELRERVDKGRKRKR